MEVKPYPSLQKKMKDYIEECQAITNPFTHRSYPSRPGPSWLAKRPKATPIKRGNMVTRHNVEKLSKPRKINVGHHPKFFHWDGLAQTKEAEATSQAPTFAQPAASLVVPMQQTAASITFMQPATVLAVPTPPMATLSSQTKKSKDIVWYAHNPENSAQKNTPCLSNQTGQIQRRKKKDTNEQNEEEEEIEDWDGELQKQKELKEQELKYNDNETPQPSP